MAFRYKYLRISVIAHFLTKSSSRNIISLSNIHSWSIAPNLVTARVSAFTALTNINQCSCSSPACFHVGTTLRILPQMSLFRRVSQTPKENDDSQQMKQAIKHLWQYPEKEDSGSCLIYQIRGLNMLRFCTMMFYVTALVGVYVAPDLISSALEHDSFNKEIVMNFATIAMAVVILPFLFTTFNSRLVLRLYYNKTKNSYLAVTQSPFMTLRKAEFSRDDVVPSGNGGVILRLFSLNTLRAKGRPYFFNPYNFNIPGDFNHLMGYD